jgi:broad specificity phosphatase PhoE
MAKLILVRHAPPQVTPDVVSPRWVLSEEGRERCGWLAKTIGAYGATRLYSSLEPKALETAALVGVRLGLNVHPWRDLHENDRAGLDFGPLEALQLRIRGFFEAPTELVIGNETANAALHRFEIAVRALASEASGQTAAVVTHGAVLSLFVASHNPVVAFDFWSALTAPSCVVLDSANFKLDGAVRNFPG